MTNKSKAEINDSGYRILALDLGEKRIGIAISDETRTLARAHSVINRSSRASDYRSIKQIIETHNARIVVVGLPTLSSGEEGTKAAWTRNYADELARSCGIRVAMWDESYSTVDAQESLRHRKIKRKRQRERIDAVAAAFILQSYLDALHEATSGTAEQ